MKKYKIAAEFKKYCFKLPFSKAVVLLSRFPLRFLQAFCRSKYVKKSCVKVGRLKADIFENKNRFNGVVVFYVHGGGFGYEAAPCQIRLALDLAEAGYKVVFPHYRLLPKHKYPAQRNDVFECYNKLCCKESDIKTVVMGDSAGGCLVAQLVADIDSYGLVTPVAQILLYPVLDGLCQTESMKEFQNTPLWNAKNNKKMWRMLTEGKNTEDASPLCSKLPNNIPVTYIEVAEIDCLRDEGLMYAERLRKAGADVSVTVVAGAMHGYDFARGTQTVAALRKKRLAFLSGFRESYKRL